MDDHERARIEMLDIDHRRMNRMLWRKHPVFALRFAMAGHFTLYGFWLPVASSLSLCMGCGAVPLEVTTRTASCSGPDPSTGPPPSLAKSNSGHAPRWRVH
jgi:hypothetical protein